MDGFRRIRPCDIISFFSGNTHLCRYIFSEFRSMTYELHNIYYKKSSTSSHYNIRFVFQRCVYFSSNVVHSIYTPARSLPVRTIVYISLNVCCSCIHIISCAQYIHITQYDVQNVSFYFFAPTAIEIDYLKGLVGDGVPENQYNIESL